MLFNKQKLTFCKLFGSIRDRDEFKEFIKIYSDESFRRNFVSAVVGSGGEIQVISEKHLNPLYLYTSWFILNLFFIRPFLLLTYVPLLSFSWTQCLFRHMVKPLQGLRGRGAPPHQRRLGWRPHSFWRSSRGSWKVRGSYCPIFLIVFLSCQHPVDRFRQVTSCCDDCHFPPLLAFILLYILCRGCSSATSLHPLSLLSPSR